MEQDEGFGLFIGWVAQVEDGEIAAEPNRVVVMGFGAQIVYDAEVEAVIEVATSMEEAHEFLASLIEKNASEIQDNQRQLLAKKLGLPTAKHR